MNIQFQALIKLLANHGIEAAKLTKTTNECIFYTHDYLKNKEMREYSCIDTAPFITMLFVGLNPDTQEEVVNKIPYIETFPDEAFEPMTVTWFSLDNELGAHECNLIYISDDEIYFIDYYMETNRDKLFRVVKFNDKKSSMELIKFALYEQDEQAFDELFDFQNTAEKNRYNVNASCRIWKIDKLPTIKNLLYLLYSSLPILSEDLKRIRNNIIKNGRSSEWETTFLQDSNYDLKDLYDPKIDELLDIYLQYEYQLKVLSKYYIVL